MPCYATLQDVSVAVDVQISTETFPTVGSTIISGLTQLFLCKKVPKTKKSLLSGVSTAFEPGKLCLVVGAPSSGKSSLLKFVSGRLDNKVEVEGKLKFNGNELPPKMVPRTAMYVPQNDHHTPALTVEETLNFSHDCQIQRMADGQDRTEANRPKVASMLHELGLHNCKDTIAGDDRHRGVSGGEKKRLTAAEMLLGPQQVLCLDDIGTGLDSAATHDIVATLRSHCHNRKTCTIISLLQPPPEVRPLFDEVLVVGNGGHIIYHGPVQLADDYITSELGCACPPATSAVDFLIDVGSDTLEHSAKLSERWKKSTCCRSYIAPRFGDSEANATDQTPRNWEFGASWVRLFWLNFVRHLQILNKDKLLIRQRVMQSLVQGVTLGTIFWQEENHALKFAVSFIFVLLTSMGNIYVIDVAARKRRVFYKQRDANLFPTLSYTLAELCAEVPQVVVETGLVGSVPFWSIGLTPSSFPTFLLTLILTSLFFLTFFKAVVAHSPTASAAHGKAMGCMAVSMCFSGFLVTKASIPNYLIWLYWITPYSWLLRVLCVNEFTSPGLNGEYDRLMPGSGASQPGERVGDVFLESFAMETDRVWVAYGLAYAFSALALAFALYTRGMHCRRYSEPRALEPNREDSARTLSALGSTSPASFDGVRSGVGDLTAAVDDFEGPLQVLGSLSVQPPAVTLTLKHVSYSLSSKQSDRTADNSSKLLLSDISAMFEPGTMTAIMGASGAGKSTLLDVIAGRKTTGTVTGEVCVNGHDVDGATIARMSGYVEQSDVHAPTQTVWEALWFSAQHRLPREVSDAERSKVVDAIVDLIELRPILHRMIGRPGGGSLSVEERKRVTIGVEMVANPGTLFLDEPTTGLDARAALRVMRVVRRVATAGRTVLCTIHQPSAEMFGLFDRLLLLKKGGEVVYNGGMGPIELDPQTGRSVHSALDMVAYLRSCSPAAPPFPPGKNPAEYMLEVIGAGTAAGRHGTDIDFAGCYQRSAMAVSALQRIHLSSRGDKPAFSSRYPAPYTTQAWLSVLRWTRAYWRNVPYSLTRVAVVALCSGLFGLSVAGGRISEVSDQAGLQSMSGAVFAAVFFSAAVQAVMGVAAIGDSKPLLARDAAAGLYPPGVLLFGVTVAELTWLLVVTVVHTFIFYPLAHLDVSTLPHYMLAVFLFVSTMCFWGQMLAALLPSTEAASLLTGASIGSMNLFSGFFMPPSAIPWPWKLFFYLTPTRFALRALMPPQFHCTATCFHLDNLASSSPTCNSPDSDSLTRLEGNGPGCSLMTDATGTVAQRLGIEFVARSLGVTATPSGSGSEEGPSLVAPLRLTVWDYYSTTTETTAAEAWEFTAGMAGFLVGFRIVTLLALTLLRHIKR